MKEKYLGESESGRLRIGYEADFAPLTFVWDGVARGLMIEALTLAFGQTEHEVEFLPVPLPDQEKWLHAGDIDAIAFKAVIPDRAGSLDFSVPIATSGGAWFSAAGRSAFDRPAMGARIATPGTGPLLAQLRRDYPDLVYLDVATYAESLASVADNSADHAALNFHVGRYLANRDHPGRFSLPERPYAPLALSLAVARGRQASMMNLLDSVLTGMRESGALGEIEARWIDD